MDSSKAPRRMARRRGAAVAFTVSFALSATLISFAPTAALARSHRRHTVYRGSSVDRAQRTLMSRGAGFDAPAAPQLTGRKGVVSVENASIYAGREQFGQLLSNVEKGQEILVIGEAGDYYAVAMQNHITGFIAKSSVDLQDMYYTTVDDATPLQKSILQSASNYLGIAPYVWGGNTMAGIDCSGFVKAVFSENGITLPRTAAQQAQVGYAVPLRDMTQWQPGDRMYFQCHHGYIDHTGLYVGNGVFIHSSINHHGVDFDKVQSPFYWNHLVAVRRSSELVTITSATSSTTAAAASAPDYESNQE